MTSIGNILRTRQHGMQIWKIRIISLLLRQWWRSPTTLILFTFRLLTNLLSLHSLNRRRPPPNQFPHQPLGHITLLPTWHPGVPGYRLSLLLLVPQPGPSIPVASPTGSTISTSSPQSPRKRILPKRILTAQPVALTWT